MKTAHKKSVTKLVDERITRLIELERKGKKIARTPMLYAMADALASKYNGN